MGSIVAVMGKRSLVEGREGKEQFYVHIRAKIALFLGCADGPIIATLLLLETGDSPATSRLNPTNTVLTSANIPTLPFPENPDPTLCGIPTIWGSANNRAWLTGIYHGVMVEPMVYLYDSHLRRAIKAQAPHGTQVKIVLFQANPVLDYYMVQILDAPIDQNEGWVPAPFISFTPIGETVRRFG